MITEDTAIEEFAEKINKIETTAKQILDIVGNTYTVREINEVCTLMQFLVDTIMQIIGQEFSPDTEQKARQRFAANVVEVEFAETAIKEHLH